MTLLVGVATRKGVWIGADSGSVAETYAISVPEPKVWKASGWIVAMAGNWRALDVVRYAVRMPKRPERATDLHRTIAIELLDAIRAAFSARGVESGDDDATRWYMLVGTRTAHGGALFSLDATESVERLPIATIGLGDEFARGVLGERSDLEPAARIRHTFKRTRELYGNLRPPYRVEAL